MSIKKEFRELLGAVEAQGGTIKIIKSGYQGLCAEWDRHRDAPWHA
jgi:hypothetical protein